MRKLVIVCILLAVAFVINMGTISNAYASTKSNKKIVKAYVNKVYPKHKIKYCKCPPRNRKSKNKVYVEILRTQSEGTGGYNNEGYYASYGRYIKKYTMVNVYIIYNPNNNECDDITNIVIKGKLKFKK